MITEIIILLLVFSGVILMFIASIGLFKMPDIYTRMSAVTKAVTFKISLIMISCSIYFFSVPTTLKSLLVILLLLLTTPVSSHLLAKEVHERKMPLWKKSLRDELKEKKEKED